MAQSTYSLSFNGSSGEVTGTTSEPRTAFTLALWAKPTAVTSGQYVSHGFQNGGTNNIRAVILGFQSGNWNLFNNGYPTGTASDTQITATAGAWQHVAWTWDGTTLKGYLNGTQQYSLTVSVDGTVTADRRTLGSSGGGNWYGGLADDFGVWSRALSGAEVAGLSTGSTDPSTLTTSLVRLWRMEEGTGTTTADGSGNGRTGTLAGGATWSSDVPAALAGGGGGGSAVGADALSYYREHIMRGAA